jgi:putative transposase
MDLQDADCRARYLIRDRDAKFPALFDSILADAGIEVVLSGIRMPRMNSIMQRWVQTTGSSRRLARRAAAPPLAW